MKYYSVNNSSNHNEDSDNVIKRVSILGSTGSIGKNTIDLIKAGGEKFKVEALTANKNVDLLAEQALKLNPSLVVIGDVSLYTKLKELLINTNIEIAAGDTALVDAASRPADWVMAAIVGAAGLLPTVEAIRQGRTVALANKEALVCGGEYVIEEARKNGTTLLPVDSEHNAIFQVFDFNNTELIEKIILTASGGPFSKFSLKQMEKVTPSQAFAHPNWDMGNKISVDSSTMMNKGLELIEAYHLFGLNEEKLDILVHPQSIVHSFVCYKDGSMLAQLGVPDMRIPISYTLAWPSRMRTRAPSLDLSKASDLSFELPDNSKFPALQIARDVLKTGGAAPTILNASNEVAVEAFMNKQIGFLDIIRVVKQVLDSTSMGKINSIDDIFAADLSARQKTEVIIENI